MTGGFGAMVETPALLLSAMTWGVTGNATAGAVEELDALGFGEKGFKCVRNPFVPGLADFSGATATFALPLTSTGTLGFVGTMSIGPGLVERSCGGLTTNPSSTRVTSTTTGSLVRG